MTSPRRGAEPIALPPPSEGGAPLMLALRRRATTRQIADAPLSPQALSDLLWAAFGVNRPAGPFGLPGRTAASASDAQEIDLFVARDDGVYLYDGLRHALAPVVAGDHRVLTLTPGQRGGSASAPVHLVYVADVDRLTHTQGFEEPGLHDPEVQRSYYLVDTGMIAAHVYLVAAAQGLAAWFHNCDRASLATLLRLRPEQHVLFAQSVGWPG